MDWPRWYDGTAFYKKTRGLMERAKITAKGKVQGVGFRNFIYIIAFESNLLGYTTNLKNGDVETVIIDALLATSKITFFFKS